MPEIMPRIVVRNGFRKLFKVKEIDEEKDSRNQKKRNEQSLKHMSIFLKECL